MAETIFYPCADKWKDFFRTGLMVWHLYALNAVSGLMNTVQQPASEVAMSLIIPEEYYQKTSGLRSLSRIFDIHIKSADCRDFHFVRKGRH